MVATGALGDTSDHLGLIAHFSAGIDKDSIELRNAGTVDDLDIGDVTRFVDFLVDPNLCVLNVGGIHPLRQSDMAEDG